MRPALADVLAVVTTCDDAVWWRTTLDNHRARLAARGVERGDGVPPTQTRGWAHATPADALAALVEAELLPAPWGDPERGPRWWCEACGGRGLRDRPGRYPCFRCDSPARAPATDPPGHTAAPSSHPALVAVASLGADALARAEELAADVWRARVAWRVAHATTLRDLMGQAYDEGSFGAGVLYVAAVAWFHPDDVADALAWWREHDPAQEKAARAVADLAALGLHVVAVDDERVTLAVESV